MNHHFTDTRLELVGARLLGPKPIRDLWIPFQPGIHALYGKNGAGKTIILRALEDLLNGVPSDSYLVAKVVSDQAPSTDDDGWYVYSKTGHADSWTTENSVPWPERSRSSWEKQVANLLWPICQEACQIMDELLYYSSEPSEYEASLWARFDEDEVDDQIRDDLEEVLTSAERYEERESGLDDEQIAAVLDEVVSQNLVALTPRDWGWQVSLAVLHDSSQPGLSKELERLWNLYDDLASGTVLGAALEHINWDKRDLVVAAMAHLFAALDGDLAKLDVSREFDELGHLRLAATVPCRLQRTSSLLLVPHAEGPAVQVVSNTSLDASTLSMDTRRRVFHDLHGSMMFNSQGGLTREFRELSDRLSEIATTIYRSFLVDAPDLVLYHVLPAQWLIEEPIAWRADVGAEEPIELDALSEAQRRWALIAIALAEATMEVPLRMAIGKDHQAPLPLVPQPMWLLLDEPDAALHATAQRHAVQGLAATAASSDVTVMVSTHSREFLADPSVTLQHVHRGSDNSTAMSSLPAIRREGLAELGLDLADLLLLRRLFLVVEGSHDEVVLGTILGDELDRLGVQMIPMRGGQNLATTVESSVFAHMSDTPVLAVLDNLKAERVNAYWDALVANTDEGQEAFDRITESHFSGKERKEEAFLINYCRAVVDLGQLHRFQMFGLSKIDIPLYLPEEVVVPGHTWSDLERDFRAQQENKSFKPWLKRRHKIEISEDVLRRAAESLDHIPEEFTDLLDACREALKWRGTAPGAPGRRER